MGPRVVYYNNIPSPYFVERTNVLVDRANVDMEVWFAARRESDRSWRVDEDDWGFPSRYLTKGEDPGAAPVPAAELRATRPDLFVTFYGGARFAAGVCVARAAARRVAVSAMVTYDTWVERTRAKEAAKHALFRSVDSAQVPGPDTVAMVGRYGLPEERAIVVTESIEVAHYARARELPAAERDRRRNDLGLAGCVFLSVGRLHPGKGIWHLLDAYSDLVARGVNASLLLVGDGPEEARVREAARTLPRLVCLGFVPRDDLPEVYGIADVFVFPTLGDPQGHVVEEAMAAGLPVISSAAAGDIRLRVPEGEAGFIVPPGDPQALADRMDVLAGDPALWARMGKKAAELASTRDHVSYAEAFERFVEKTLSLPERRNPVALAARSAGWGLMNASRRRPASYVGADA